MSTTERDAGLIPGLGTWGLAASIARIVGAGIFAVPGGLAAAVGPHAPLVQSRFPPAAGLKSGSAAE